MFKERMSKVVNVMVGAYIKPWNFSNKSQNLCGYSFQIMKASEYYPLRASQVVHVKNYPYFISDVLN